MIDVLLPLVLAAAPPGPGAAAGSAGTQTWSVVEAGRLVLAGLDPARPKSADTGAAAAPAEPERSNAEVETYIRFHLDAAAGDARSRLMPWPELRSLAP